MSFVIAAPDLVQGAAHDLAGIRASLAEAAATVAGPTTGLVPAAADEVSAAISAMFGNFGEQFQLLSAQAQAFHNQFVSLMNAGAGAYLNTEISNAELAAVNAISGGGSAGAATPSAGSGLLGGLLGGLTGSSGRGGLLGGLAAATTGGGGLLGGLAAETTGGGGLLGGLTGGLVGGVTNGLLGGSGGLLGGLLGPTPLGLLVGGLFGSSGLGLIHTGPFDGIFAPFVRELRALEQAFLNELHSVEQAVVNAIGGGGSFAAAAAATPGAGLLGGLLGGSGGSSGVTGLVGGLTGGSSPVTGLLGGLSGGGLSGLTGSLVNSLAPNVNSLLPGLVGLQAGPSTGTGFTGIVGPYEELVANTSNNFGSLVSGWLANPFPFLRQVGANFAGYGQIAATALTTGNLQLLAEIPADISHNAGNVFATLTDFSITPEVEISLLPLSVTLDTFVGLPLVFAIDVVGAPAATFEAAAFSFGAFTSALQTGNFGGAFAALFDAPAVIANGFLNGQATLPFGLSLSGVPVVGSLLPATVDATLNLPFDGILHPPGFYGATVTVSVPPVLPPTTVNVDVGGTPFSGLAPFLVNYAPEQLALAIGAPANPPPVIGIPL
jgi:PE family